MLALAGLPLLPSVVGLLFACWSWTARRRMFYVLYLAGSTFEPRRWATDLVARWYAAALIWIHGPPARRLKLGGAARHVAKALHAIDGALKLHALPVRWVGLALDGADGFPEAAGDSASAKTFARLQTLYITQGSLASFPPDARSDAAPLHAVADLRDVWLIGCGLKELSADVKRLQSMHTLRVDSNDLRSFPAALGECLSLRALWCTRNQVAAFPDAMAKLTGLTELRAGFNRFTALPAFFADVSAAGKLETVCLSSNAIERVCERVRGLTSVKKLNLSGNAIGTIAAEVGALSALQQLWLHHNQIVSVPDAIGQCANLWRLHIGNNRIRRLPPALGDAKMLFSLSLLGNTNADNELADFRSLELCTSLRFLEANASDCGLALRGSTGGDGQPVLPPALHTWLTDAPVDACALARAASGGALPDVQRAEQCPLARISGGGAASVLVWGNGPVSRRCTGGMAFTSIVRFNVFDTSFPPAHLTTAVMINSGLCRMQCYWDWLFSVFSLDQLLRMHLLVTADGLRNLSMGLTFLPKESPLRRRIASIWTSFVVTSEPPDVLDPTTGFACLHALVDTWRLPRGCIKSTGFTFEGVSIHNWDYERRWFEERVRGGWIVPF